MTPKDRALELVRKKQLNEDDWAVVIEGELPCEMDGFAHFTIFVGMERAADLYLETAVKLIAGVISAAESAAWIESGVCRVCKKLLTEHPPGPACYPKTG